MPARPDDSHTTLQLMAATPLDVLSARSMTGREALNELFLFQVECLCSDTTLALDKALGQHATITLQAGKIKRPLDGLCARISQWPGDPGFIRYTLELRPWLWWLTLSSNKRIFQGKSVPEIVEAVIKAHGYTDYEWKLKAHYAARDYCVQYNETDFAFVSRLLEEEGIFYFFRHQSQRHVMVLADANDTFPPCPGGGHIAFKLLAVGVRESNAVHNGQLELQAVSGSYSATDYEFKTPKTSLFTQAKTDASAPAIYDYPGGYGSKAAGDALSKKRVDGLRTQARQFSGESDSRALVPGHKFTLSGHERRDINIEWVVREVHHEATHQQYGNHFVALPFASTYRPPRNTPKSRIYGTQTAVVVGKNGEDIWTDKYGRIKVQFHWDRLGKKDEHSSCWVRVAQMWSGNGWGSQFIPRVGQEVVVSFFDGDPDRPLVTACVYNGSNALPYTLPAEQTKSAIKSQSSKGGGGFNEIRFEDKKDAEELYLHAQKNMRTEVLGDATRIVGNDDILQVKNNQTLEVQEGQQKITLAKGSRDTMISEGADTLTVKGKRKVAVDGEEVHQNKVDFTHAVDGNYTLTIKGDLTIDVTGSIKIKSGKDLIHEAGMAIKNTAGTDLSNKAGAALNNTAGTALSNKAGTSLINDAGISLSNKAGASQTLDGGGMLMLKGGLVKIN